MNGRGLRFLAVLVFGACAGASPSVAPRPPAPEVRSEAVERFVASRREPRIEAPSVAAGDKLRVKVRDFEEASRDYVVDESGAIEVPALGRLSVAGQKTAEIDEALEFLLHPMLVNTEVEVVLVDSASSEAVVSGAVKKPGEVELGGPAIALLQAIKLAGGFAPDASGVVRITAAPAPDGGGEETAELSSADLLGGAGALFLRPGDRVEVVSVGQGPTAGTTIAEPGPAPPSTTIPERSEVPETGTRQPETADRGSRAAGPAGPRGFELGRSQREAKTAPELEVVRSRITRLASEHRASLSSTIAGLERERRRLEEKAEEWKRLAREIAGVIADLGGELDSSTSRTPGAELELR